MRPHGRPPALKRFGQHFLVDRGVLERIADALLLTGTETVVEIGPGHGELTELIRPRAGRLVLVEIDRALAAALRERYAGDSQVTVLEQDVLRTDLAAVAGGPYVVAGNVPYYITTPILFRALRPPRPLRAVFLVQREVGERIAAGPGTGAYGALGVNVQAVARPQLLFTVPARAFRPPPKVESAVVRITPRQVPLVSDSDVERFQAFVQSVFALRRKQLQRVIRTLTGLDAETSRDLIEREGWNPTDRPETFPPEELVRLYLAVHGIGLGALLSGVRDYPTPET